MDVLRVVTQVVGINLLMTLGTLAGAVVLGVFPALASGGALLSRLAAGAPSDRLWGEFWTGWRAGLRRMNVLGSPFWVVGLVTAADAGVLAVASGFTARLLTVALALLGLYLAVVLAFLFPVARRYDEPAVRTWRFLAVAPLIAPGTTLAVLAVLAVSAVLYQRLPVLVPLVGVAFPLLNAGWIVDRQLDGVDAGRAG